jgi:protein-tyrosine phosphatase
MIDLHSHLLPGVDDGSKSVQQSARVLRHFADRGVTHVACTPHLLASRVPEGFPRAYEQAWDALRPVCPAEITLHRGVELMLDRPVPDEVAERLLTIAGSRYLLVEFARMVPAEIVTRALADVTDHGLTPVLAHPERYSSCSVDTVRSWRELGTIMQVDATTLTAEGSRGERARDLVREGLADILAGDNHGDERCIATALDWLTEQDGGDQAVMMLDTNPRAIIEDRTLYEVDPLPVSRSIWRRVRNMLGDG